MRDLSLHLMDIVQNALKAQANRIDVLFEADPAADKLLMVVRDNGCGMSSDFLQQVTDPFFTTRTTRSVGLGIPLLKESCEQSGGSLDLRSEVGRGTVLTAAFGLSSIDRLPIGSISETMKSLIVADPSIDYALILMTPERRFELDLADIRRQLDEVPPNDPLVLDWLGSYIAEQQDYIFGGVLHEIISRT